MSGGFFDGEERLAVFEGLGYRTRKGNPQSLEVSDRECLERAIEAEDGALAQAYLDVLLPRHRDMLATLLEWALQFPASARELTTAAQEQALSRRAFHRFLVESASLASDAPTAALAARVADRLGRATPEDASELHRQKATGASRSAMGLIDEVEEQAEGLKRLLSVGDWPQARSRLADYFACCVTLHDALINFTSAYPAVAIEEHGAEFALELVRHSFSSLSGYEGLWALPKLLDTEGLAAFLAEHLRAHFSGPDRGGSVRIEEDEESYRLVFDPCGSGGALRRRLAGRLEGAVLKDAHPMTWGRPGEVPAYCTHCAHNELVSIERFGYPLLVTEFDPDPYRPCGWTLYKRPEAVPDRYYCRLGVEPPPAE